MQVKHIILSFVILFLAFGCADVRPPQSEKDGYLIQLPWYDKDKGYTLQKISVKTIENIDEIRGSSARFYVYPYLKNGELTGPAPTARYIKTNEGTIIPRDVITTQLFTVYAHMEKLKEFDKQMGVGDFATWPATVGIAVNYRDEYGELVDNNAAYSSALNAYLFMPYTDNKLPIAVNGAVIGHEHFHALFAKLVNFAPSTDSSNNLEEDRLLKAFELHSEKMSAKEEDIEVSVHANRILYKIMNEGLADFWGWLYSQNDNFVGQSLSKERGERKIEKQNLNLISKSDLMSQAASIDDRKIYQYGNIYARIFSNFVKHYSITHEVSLDEARLIVGKNLIASLRDLNTVAIKLHSEKEAVDPTSLVSIFIENLKDAKLEDCQYFTSVLPDKNDVLASHNCVALQKGADHALGVD